MVDSTHRYNPNIMVTVTVGNLPGAAPDLVYQLPVSPELVFTDDLEGKGIHEALKQAGYAVTDKMFAEAREERRERERLEMLLGGPVTEVDQECRMTQPDGKPCGGQFREVSRG